MGMDAITALIKRDPTYESDDITTEAIAERIRDGRLTESEGRTALIWLNRAADPWNRTERTLARLLTYPLNWFDPECGEAFITNLEAIKDAAQTMIERAQAYQAESFR